MANPIDISPDNQKPVTITDVARAAGVGVGTVSRVINEAKGVSPSMAQRVRSVIQRIGYRPPLPAFRPGPRNRLVAASGKRTSRVELVIMFPLGLGSMEEQAPLYSNTMDGIESDLSKRGIDLVVRQSRSWPEQMPSGQGELLGRIYFGTPESDEPPPPGQFHIPSVWAMGSPPLVFTGDHVVGDHHAAGQLAASHLMSMGHTHCAYIGTDRGSPACHGGYRADAFRYQVQHQGGKVLTFIDPRLIELSKYRHVVDRDRMASHLERIRTTQPTPPTALCLQTDMFSPVVYQILGEMGIRPQRDLFIIACDSDPKLHRSLKPPPMAIDIHTDQISRQTVDTLLWRGEHPEHPSLRILVRPTLAT